MTGPARAGRVRKQGGHRHAAPSVKPDVGEVEQVLPVATGQRTCSRPCQERVQQARRRFRACRGARHRESGDRAAASCK